MLDYIRKRHYQNEMNVQQCIKFDNACLNATLHSWVGYVSASPLSGAQTTPPQWPSPCIRGDNALKVTLHQRSQCISLH